MYQVEQHLSDIWQVLATSPVARDERRVAGIGKACGRVKKTQLITAWLEIRNKAAHGHYTEYTADQVRAMISGVTEYMAKVHV